MLVCWDIGHSSILFVKYSRLLVLLEYMYVRLDCMLQQDYLSF